jgi:S1-C subfamily serine protease
MFKAILLSLILCLPASAETLTGQVARSQFIVRVARPALQGTVEESPSPALVDETAQSSQVLKGNSNQFNLSASHGDQGVGVIGAYVFNTGVIRTIYPCSDLNNYGIAPGDRILQADGMSWSHFLRVINAFEKSYDPGQTINLYISREGNTIKIALKLIDARQLANFAMDDHLSTCLQHTRSW